MPSKQLTKHFDLIIKAGTVATTDTTETCDIGIQNGKISEKFKEQMNRLSKKNGWFVPVSTLLDFLKTKNKIQIINSKQRTALEWKWLFDKLILGPT